MNCSEFHELAAAYSLDALSEEERLAALHHLREEGPHEGCEELVARFEHAVDQLGVIVKPVEPPPSLWRIIELRLGLASAGEVIPLAAKLTPLPSRWREGLAWAAAAAALLGALWSHQTAQRTQSYAQEEHDTRLKTAEELSSTNVQLAQTENARKLCASALERITEQSVLGRDAVALLEQPATKIAPFAAAGAQTYRATALYNRDSKRAVVISTTVPRVEGKDYELWVIAGTNPPQPAGFIRFDPSGVAIGEFDAALLRGATPAALAVSLEPAGGRPTPTEVVLVAKLSG